jgi:flagellar basal body-associated protein FliL
MSDEQDDVKPKGRPVWLVPVATLVVGAALGGAGGWFGPKLMGEGNAATPAEEPAAAAHGEAAAPAAEAGAHGAPAPSAHGEAPAAEGHAALPAATSAVTSIGSFTVNLRGGGGGRLLRLEVSVEGPPGQAAIIESKQAQLRDSIIAAVSDYTWNELEGAAGKTRLRDELYARANGVVAPASVDRIYFTQFVVQ